MYRLYSVLGNAQIASVEVIENPSPQTGQEYIFKYHCEKAISVAQKQEAETVLDALIAQLQISDPENQLASVQTERNAIVA